MTLSHLALAISAALLDGLWEGPLIVGTVWLGLRALPKLGSTSRYTIWLCTLLALIAIPVFSAFTSRQIPQSQPPAGPVASRNAVLLLSPSVPDLAPALPRSTAKANVPLPSSSQGQRAHRALSIEIPQQLALAIALLWFIAVFVRTCRLLFDFFEVRTIRREGKAWSKAYDFPVFLSERVSVPIAIGFLQPAVILPSAIFDQVDQNALEGIIIHESAHLHRYDVWTNALARIGQALLALNPAAWFVMHHLSVERELACDDCVVARIGDGNPLARALAAMAVGADLRVPIAAAGAIETRHSVVVRIERLLDSRPRRLQLSLSALGGALMLLALLAFTMQAVSPALAFAPQTIVPQQNAPLMLAANCTQRDVGPMRDHTLGPAGPRMIRESLPADFLAQSIERYPTTITYSVAVDARGHQHDFKTLHSSNNASVDQQVRRWVMESTFKPAIHNCVATAGTFISGASRLPGPKVFVVVRPATPVIYAKRGERLTGTCKTPHRDPAIVRSVTPKLTDAMKTRIAATQTTFLSSVLVHLTASGAVSGTTMQRSSGQKAFDDATLAAAERTTYAPRIVNCTAVPGDYHIMAAFTEWMEP